MSTNTTRHRMETSRGPIATLLALCAILFGCGGAPLSEDGDLAEPVELGKLEQPMFFFNNYGIEEGDSTRCTTPTWSGGICKMPRFREMKWIINSGGSCNVPWFTARAQGAVTGWNQMHLAWDSGWTVQNISVFDWSTTNRGVMISCTMENPPTPFTLGRMFDLDFTCDGHTGAGDVCRLKKAEIKVYGQHINNMCSGLTQAKCDRLTENVVRHELGHWHGLGHFGTGDSTLMASSHGSHYGDATLSPSNFELDLIAGYCPDGSTAGCD